MSRSLNPCFSGTYSRRPGYYYFATERGVLILVLVEHTLGEFYKDVERFRSKVLILVLVEHTLGGNYVLLKTLLDKS